MTIKDAITRGVLMGLTAKGLFFITDEFSLQVTLIIMLFLLITILFSRYLERLYVKKNGQKPDMKNMEIIRGNKLFAATAATHGGMVLILSLIGITKTVYELARILVSH